MDYNPSLQGFRSNPGFGSGAARRRIRLTGSPGQVVGELEDIVHGMRCTIRHDGERVTAIEGEMVRIPLTSCAGAGSALQAVVSMPIRAEVASFYADGRARLNCTHLFDLAWLTLAHCARGAVSRDYDFAMPDERDGITVATLRRDGDIALSWTLLDGRIVNDGPWAGRRPLKGFVRWAMETLEGDELEAALVAQKGCFVAQARRFLVDAATVRPAEQPEMTGVCFGYAPSRIADARRLPRFHPAFDGHDPDVLLRFLP